MSSDKPAKKRKYREIPSIRATQQETKATQDTVKRMLGRLPMEKEKEPTPVTPVTGVTGVSGDIAPKRDFTKFANSIVRDAVPAGAFTGKGKQLYDYLYSQTRGAIVPTRSARITTDTLMKCAGMTRHTFRTHMQRLLHTGLVEVEERPGEHGGNVYTVYLPEEVGINRGDRGDRGHRGDPGQFLPLVQGSEIDPCDRGSFVENKDTSGDPKTYIKTDEKFDDDDALAGLVAALNRAAREVTGKSPSAADSARWSEVGEVLATELKIAAARTTVSSAPAFLAEHLRRRLWKVDKKQARAEGRELPDEKRVAQPGEQTSKCPDCGGTGFFYPNGYEAGVAKCRHKNLEQEQGETEQPK